MTPGVIQVASGREWRGGQRQVWLLARELHRLGVDQVVVTGAGTELASRLRASGIRVRPAAWQAGLDPRVLPPVFAELRRGFSLLHAHDAHAVTLAGICAGITRTPMVATRRVDFHLRRRGFWGRADRLIAISHAVAEVLVSDGIPRERVTVVHSGISIEGLRATTRLGVRGRLGLSPETLVAVNVAALTPHKDHLNLLGAARFLKQRFPELHWAVAGEGPLRAELEQRIERESLRGRVHLLGHIDSPERLIADGDVFVMSSQEEGLGSSVLDAMALGIPVASTAAGGLPELIGNGAGLLAPPRDPAALAEAVGRILSEPSLRQQLVERAKQEVLRFTDRRMAEQVRSVYRSVAHSLDGS